ncbi:MaoC family dehydratase [Vineibacter terrae]|uniref:MaoC family dehydratase n=1 Tax=Vineibacter terrae TaxID=2586908 RepID=UPI002E36AE59|nr:MaoC family dehydratase [Vineibacter terrae]HEX2891180.1 MaoC family dehydratase [Vineibacter terrae]
MSGLFYEELEVGRTYEHSVRRTVTEADNVLYCGLTMCLSPAYLDHEAAARSKWKKPLVNPFLILSNIIGMHVIEMTAGTTHGNLGMTDLEFPVPVHPGDTLRSRTTIKSKRPSKSQKGSGIVIFLHEGVNQRDEVVMRCDRAALMIMRTAGAA